MKFSVSCSLILLISSIFAQSLEEEKASLVSKYKVQAMVLDILSKQYPSRTDLKAIRDIFKVMSEIDVHRENPIPLEEELDNISDKVKEDRDVGEIYGKLMRKSNMNKTDSQ